MQWRLPFLALEHHFVASQPDIYIWFDLFSNNQHKAPNLPFEWWRDTFLNAIGKIGRVVMVLSPWNNPIPFTRAWCLWEIYCAVSTESKFEVAITPDPDSPDSEETSFPKNYTHVTFRFEIPKTTPL